MKIGQHADNIVIIVSSNIDQTRRNGFLLKRSFLAVTTFDFGGLIPDGKLLAGLTNKLIIESGAVGCSINNLVFTKSLSSL